MKEDKLSSLYVEALQDQGEAFEAFRVLQKQYRERLIGDEAFLAGRKLKLIADKAFDRAFALETGHLPNKERQS